MAADCALAFEPVAFESGKSLDYQLTEDVLVLGDRDKLRQLASILLDNAIKYGRDGTSVRMALRKTDRQAVLTVANEGDPIPAEQLSHLFERFYRADASRGEVGLRSGPCYRQNHHGCAQGVPSGRRAPPGRPASSAPFL